MARPSTRFCASFCLRNHARTLLRWRGLAKNPDWAESQSREGCAVFDVMISTVSLFFK
jgi:hypothetical protein